MPNFDLKVLSEVEKLPVSPNSIYCLFMMGTNNTYIDKPSIKNYPNGETFSYIAQVIATTLKEEPKIDANSDLSFSSPSVSVIKGPTTFAWEVGDRILLGVFLILKGLAEGKTDFQISGFSRGGAVAHLIAHELDRVLKELITHKDKTIYQILLETPCPYTQSAVKKNCEEANESPEVRRLLGHCFLQSKINLFLLDPVPGTGFYLPGTALYLPRMEWWDDRFSKKPEKSALKIEIQLLIARHEGSRFFYPIAPDGVPFITIPGHHSTGTGNMLTQTLEPLPDQYKDNDISTVQQLVVFKLLYTLNTRDLFSNYIGTIELQHPLLDKLTNEFITTKDKSKKLLELWQKVHTNNTALNHFLKTSYATGISLSPTSHRWVHHAGYTEKSLDSILPELGDEFLSTEHAQLYLADVIPAPVEENDPLKLVQSLRDTLKSLIQSDNERNQKTRALLANQHGRKMIFHALTIFIKMISQKYLANHLSVEQKTQLLQEIDTAFSLIKEWEKHNRLIASECLMVFGEGIRDTAETHYNSLTEQAKLLISITKDIHKLDRSFQQDLQHFLLELQKRVAETALENREKREFLQSLIQVFAEKGGSLTYDSFVALFTEHVAVQINNPHARDVFILARGINDKPLEQYFNGRLSNPKAYILRLIRLHEDIDHLINGFDHVQLLVGEDKKLNIDIDLLIQYRASLIEPMALLIIRQKIDLRHRPDCMSEEIFKVVKNKAIELGAKNPEIEDLKNSLDADRAKIKDLTAKNERLSQRLEEHRTLVRERDKAIAQLNDKQQQSIKEITQLRTNHGRNIYALAALNRTNQKVTTEKDAQTQRAEDLSQTTVKLQQTIDTINQESSVQKEAIKNLQKENEKQKQNYQSVTKAHIELQQQHVLQTETLENLYGEKERSDETVTNLTASHATLQQRYVLQTETIRNLQNEQEVQNQVIQNLKQTNVQSQNEIANQKQQIDNQGLIIDRLTDKNEIICANLIETKLLPLTNSYRLHLIEQAQKFNPSILRTHVGNLPALENDNDQEYEKINAKYTKINLLLENLQDRKNYPLASKRIENFSKNMELNAAEIEKDRGLCGRYIKNCLIALGILGTGIIPGLAILAAYSAYAHKSSPLFFSKSHGMEYTESIEKSLQSAPVA